MLRADRGGSVVKINQNCSSIVEKRVALHVITPPLVIGERTVVMSVSVSVCLFARIFREFYVHSLPNFLQILTMAVAWSSSGGVAICYVLPVLRMTSLNFIHFWIWQCMSHGS